MGFSNNTTDYMKYCPKCGHINLYINNCIRCGTAMKTTKYTVAEYWKCKDNSMDQVIYDEYIKNNPLYNQNEADRQEAIIQKRYDDYNRKKAQQVVKQANKVTCPYCKSSNVSKISTVSRGVSIGFFGLASKKIGKQFHCNSCKADF